MLPFADPIGASFEDERVSEIALSDIQETGPADRRPKGQQRATRRVEACEETAPSGLTVQSLEPSAAVTVPVMKGL